ncbi:Thiol-disulfide oxidoreductase lto1 [Thalictrum thalictroides]|uniref:Thiol-disulfide oxidoreductase lto1 n=1 Tax=Thalictrum thalictroides TaxID=46969 RepID=A0A7J6V1Y6_THATH|nr:Thiol-disulfide oxidoreductase lto1 [Thalictrum thalictroides]
MVAMTASFICTSTPPSHSKNSNFCSPAPISIPTQSKRRVMFFVKCLQGPSTENTKEETEEESFISTLSQSSIWTYNLCAGIGAVGFLETGYLTYLKVTGTEAFCPIGGGSCTDILNSDYATVFGVPLPLIGMTAYGLVSSLGLLLSRTNFPSGLGEANGRLILLGITTSMATASGYFLYLLSTKFTGASCSYCFLSVALSFTLFIAMLKDLGWQEIKNMVGLQILVAGLVVAALNTSYITSQPVVASFNDVYLPFYETTIEKPSSPLALSLAKHLRSVGAKMYGAFWCSHCLEQKQMFGYEAAKILDYVECFPEGVFKGTKMDKACSAVGIEGFPTWVINGQVLSGEKDFTELAKISGFNHEDVEPS